MTQSSSSKGLSSLRSWKSLTFNSTLLTHMHTCVYLKIFKVVHPPFSAKNVWYRLEVTFETKPILFSHLQTAKRHVYVVQDPPYGAKFGPRRRRRQRHVGVDHVSMIGGKRNLCWEGKSVLRGGTCVLSWYLAKELRKRGQGVKREKGWLPQLPSLPTRSWQLTKEKGHIIKHFGAE